MGGCIPYPFPPIEEATTTPQYAFKKNCKDICSNTAYGNETFEYELDKRKGIINWEKINAIIIFSKKCQSFIC